MMCKKEQSKIYERVQWELVMKVNKSEANAIEKVEGIVQKKINS
jgi:hypothetical protein